MFKLRISPRFLCRPTAFCLTCWSRGTSECSPLGNQQICRSNSGSAHFHVSWLSDFIFYPKPLYKSLHQSFFYSRLQQVEQKAVGRQRNLGLAENEVLKHGEISNNFSDQTSCLYRVIFDKKYIFYLGIY